MNLILWMVFAACLAHQAHADYWVEIKSLVSFTDRITVTEDDPEKGDLKLTNHEGRDGSTFKATIVQGTCSEKATIGGKVCDINDETPEGMVAKIFQRAVKGNNCPFTEGDQQVSRVFKIEGNVFDQYISPNCGDLSIEAKVYGAKSDGSDPDFYWNIMIYPDEGGEDEEAEAKKKEE